MQSVTDVRNQSGEDDMQCTIPFGIGMLLKKCNNWYIISTWGFIVVFSVLALGLDWVGIIDFKGKLTLWVLKLDSNSCAWLIL